MKLNMLILSNILILSCAIGLVLNIHSVPDQPYPHKYVIGDIVCLADDIRAVLVDMDYASDIIFVKFPIDEEKHQYIISTINEWKVKNCN